MINDNTRLFFIVDSLEDNEEIFSTYGNAKEAYDEIDKIFKPRICIALVNNAYFDSAEHWNYEDNSNTFEIVKDIT